MLKLIRILIALSVFIFSYANAAPFLKGMEGQSIDFSNLRGKWVLINYWAGWCQLCIDEIPELNDFYESNKDKNILLYAVNFDDLPIAAQQQLIQQFDIRYPSLQENPAKALRLGHIVGVPVTFIFNPDGELTGTLYGAQTAESLQEALSFRITS